MLHALLCIFVSVLVAAESAPPPFWQAKEKAVARIANGEILVAAHTEKPLLYIEGGGHVRAPRDFVYAFAKDFDHIEHLGIYVESSHYDPATANVSLHMSALGRSADFVVHVQSFDGEEPRRVSFAIVKGPLQGLHADLQFRALGALKTEVGIHGEYRSTDPALYKFLLEFGLEVVFRRMAERLRSQVQTAFRAGVK